MNRANHGLLGCLPDQTESILTDTLNWNSPIHGLGLYIILPYVRLGWAEALYYQCMAWWTLTVAR
jgi:hypothetical protein